MQLIQVVTLILVLYGGGNSITVH